MFPFFFAQEKVEVVIATTNYSTPTQSLKVRGPAHTHETTENEVDEFQRSAINPKTLSVTRTKPEIGNSVIQKISSAKRVLNQKSKIKKVKKHKQETQLNPTILKLNDNNLTAIQS